MSKVRIVDYVAEFIAKLGVKNIFMLSGTGSVYLDDALAFHKDINHVCARHEAAAVTMASAASKLSNDLSVVISTTGPGATNAIGGVVEAWVDSLPVLIFSGQVACDQILPGIRSFGIQGFNVIENVKKITKYSYCVTDPSTIRYHLEKAVFLAKTGRAGPVWIDLPMDVQGAYIDPESLCAFEKPSLRIAEVKKEVEDVLETLQKSKKPLVVFGQGIRYGNSVGELEELLRQLDMPAICSRMGLDILQANPNFFGLGGVRGNSSANFAMENSDFILALGTSFTHAFGGKTFNLINPSCKLAMINIDEDEMKKEGLRIDIRAAVDVKYFLENLLANIKTKRDMPKFSSWCQSCAKNWDRERLSLGNERTAPINSYYLVETLNKLSNSEHIFCNDAGGANYVSSQGLRLKKGQREITSGAFYSMGIAVPLAIGASVTEPEKQILVVTGDGSIELNIQELRTISQNNLNIKIFIINNGGYASIRKSQDEMAGGRYTDDQDVLVFKDVAKAFKLEYRLIDDPEKMSLEIRDELSTKSACIIEVICDPNQEIIDSLSYKNYLGD